jgi:integrase
MIIVARMLPEGARDIMQNSNIGRKLPARSKQNLTDRALKALEKRPALEGETYDVMDTVVPGFGVRVSEKGRRTFILVARYPGSKNPTRRALGQYGALTLEKARNKARSWMGLIEKGIDPADDEERQRLAEQRKRQNSFAAVAEEFISYIHRQKLRTAAVMERDLRQVFVTRWGPRPITEIGSDDVKRVIRTAVDRGATYQAFHHFALIRRLFNWAIGTDDYGLELNPCRRLNSADLIGERYARDRVLTDDELRALWRAIERLGYPHAPLYRLLLLTGLRLGEVCGAHWSEFDLEKCEWTIPAGRMKKVKGGAKPFMVPLTDAMMGVLNSLPRFNSGEFLFSHSHGMRPLKPNQFSDIKERLDRVMVEELRKIATANGKDPKRVTLPDFVNHDIRRTVRTHLSALRIGEEVREAVLAHVRPGIKAVYDKHQYFEEKREALTLWNARLRDIVEPPPTNVVTLRA